MSQAHGHWRVSCSRIRQLLLGRRMLRRSDKCWMDQFRFVADRYGKREPSSGDKTPLLLRLPFILFVALVRDRGRSQRQSAIGAMFCRSYHGGSTIGCPAWRGGGSRRRRNLCLSRPRS